MKESAQAGLEFLIAAAIIFAMLLFGILFIMQQNSISSQILNANSDNIECNKIADVVSRVYASQDIAEQNIFIAKTAQIKRTGNFPGQITVGSYYCNYFGNAKLIEIPEKTDITGFTLNMGNYKLSKTTGSTPYYVAFTSQP